VVAVLAPEPVRPRMAGMGIRALELARALDREFDVRLLVPNAPEEAAEAVGDLPVHAARADALGPAARDVDAAVVSGHAANWWFRQVPEVPVAADLYDPFPIENLHYAATLGPETARHDRATLELALARADFFLCASAEQRLFYAGALYAAGRIGPESFPGDWALERLLAVVPFGVPEEPARGDRAAGRRAAGLPDSGPLVLFGGIYDWYDPDLLLEAWPRILRAQPQARLLFFQNPNPATTPQEAFARAVRKARTLDPSGRSIVFSPWLPYAERADLYAAAELIVSVGAEGLETDLSYRTRLLDAAWGGVPCLAVHGGTLARELEEAGAARRLERDPQALAAHVVQWLTDAQERSRAAAAARRFAASRNWREVVRPLADWCRGAAVDPNRLPFPAEVPRPFWRAVSRLRIFRQAGDA
jgi:glycosyltransferase involved in cell wall biosynthesis